MVSIKLVLTDIRYENWDITKFSFYYYSKNIHTHFFLSLEIKLDIWTADIRILVIWSRKKLSDVLLQDEKLITIGAPFIKTSNNFCLKCSAFFLKETWKSFYLNVKSTKLYHHLPMFFSYVLFKLLSLLTT